MFDVVLYQPCIAPNVGNIIRLCANTGSQLHLIRPLGFELDDRRMRRAGLDYHEFVNMQVHDDWHAFLLSRKPSPERLFALTSHGLTAPSDQTFARGDVLLFGSETSGLPVEIREGIARDRHLRIPMCPGNRSLNLSNAVAITVYEAWRQQGYAGARVDQAS